MIDFIQDDDRLREERKKAKKNKDKYVGMSSEAMGGYGGSGWNSSSWQDNWPRGGGGGEHASFIIQNDDTRFICSTSHQYYTCKPN